MFKIFALGLLVSVSAFAFQKDSPEPGFVITPIDGKKPLISYYDLKEYATRFRLTFTDNAGTAEERLTRAFARAQTLSPQLSFKLKKEREETLKDDPNFENYRIGVAVICEESNQAFTDEGYVAQAISYLPSQAEALSENSDPSLCGSKPPFHLTHHLRSEKYPDVSMIADATDDLSNVEKVAYEVHRLLQRLLGKTNTTPREIRYLTAWIMSDVNNEISRFSKNEYIQMLLYINGLRSDMPKK